MPFEYYGIVENILAKKGFVYHFLGTDHYSFNSPLYSYLTVGTYLLTGHSHLAMLLIQSLFSSMTALVIFLVARRLFNEKIAIFAMVLTAFHPGYLYYDIFNLIPLSMDAFLIALTALSFLRFEDKPNFKKIFFTGLIIGLATLSRGIIGSVAGFLIVYIFLNKSYAFRSKIKFVLVLTMGIFAILSPWLFRNYKIHKKIILVSTTGENLWRGNNIYATGTSLSKEGKPLFNVFPEDFRSKVTSLSELEQKEFFEHEALDFIKNHPLLFLKLYAKKLCYFWWFSPQSGFSYPAWIILPYKIFYGFSMFFTITGLILAFLINKTSRGRFLIPLGIVMAICLTQSIFYVEGRHRWLIEPLLSVFFGYGLTATYEFLQDRKKGCDSKKFCS